MILTAFKDKVVHQNSRFTETGVCLDFRSRLIHIWFSLSIFGRNTACGRDRIKTDDSFPCQIAHKVTCALYIPNPKSNSMRRSAPEAWNRQLLLRRKYNKGYRTVSRVQRVLLNTPCVFCTNTRPRKPSNEGLSPNSRAFHHIYKCQRLKATQSKEVMMKGIVGDVGDANETVRHMIKKKRLQLLITKKNKNLITMRDA